MNWSIVSAAFLLVTVLALGGPLLSALLHLANARRITWRSEIAPYAHRSVQLLPLAAVLLGLLLALPGATFPWYGSHGHHVNAWHDYRFLVGRELIAFVLVAALSIAFIRASDTHASGRGSEAARLRLTYLAAAVVTAYVLYASLLAWDFEMTLQPGWRSSMFAVNFFISGFQCSLAVLVLAMLAVRRLTQGRHSLTHGSFNALAQLMLGFTLFWIYTFFGQFLTIWYAALPEETHRLYLMLYEAGDIRNEPARIAPLFWSFLFLKSFVPFLMLIFEPFRHRPGLTALPALAIVVGSFLERFTWVAPLRNGWSLPFSTVFDLAVVITVLGLTAALLRADFRRTASRAA